MTTAKVMSPGLEQAWNLYLAWKELDRRSREGIVEPVKAEPWRCAKCKVPTGEGARHLDRCVWCANGIARMVPCGKCDGAGSYLCGWDDCWTEHECKECDEGEVCLNSDWLDRLQALEDEREAGHP